MKNRRNVCVMALGRSFVPVGVKRPVNIRIVSIRNGKQKKRLNPQIPMNRYMLKAKQKSP
jgi:hypothetical protein